MTVLADEFRRRRDLLRNLDYKEAKARLSGFYNWLVSQSETARIVEHILAEANVDRLVKSARHGAPPPASTPIEIAAIGLHLMKKSAEGQEPYMLVDSMGIRPPYGQGHAQDYLGEAQQRYIEPALDYMEHQIRETAEARTHQAGTDAYPDDYPLEIVDSLDQFRRDHPEYRLNAFLMMRYGETPAHKGIVKTVRNTLSKYKIEGLRADDKQYHDELLPNVLTYMHGCSFGIAVFERLETEEFNPNVSLEVGYMRARRKPVCLLKDRTLKTLQTDLMGSLYKSFDPQDPAGTIPMELERWLRDKEIITL